MAERSAILQPSDRDLQILFAAVLRALRHGISTGLRAFFPTDSQSIPISVPLRSLMSAMPAISSSSARTAFFHIPLWKCCLIHIPVNTIGPLRKMFFHPVYTTPGKKRSPQQGKRWTAVQSCNDPMRSKCACKARKASAFMGTYCPFEAPCKDCIARILPFAANRKSAPIGAPQGRIERPCFLSIHVFVCKQ